jgi:hypothetical protein
VKGLADCCLALRRIKHPGPGLPRRVVAQMLGVTAGQFNHPMTVLVLNKAGND